MGTRVRINAQLIDSDSGSHIWAEKFDRDLAELFTVQDQVVQTIVSTLVGRVQASDFERGRREAPASLAASECVLGGNALPGTPPARLAAYECVLKGNALPWDDPDGAAEAARLFEQPIEIDPGYGFPHALLASIWQGKWRDDPSSSDAALRKAFALAKRAVELGQNESTCFALLGWVELMRRSYDLALQHVRRAVEMNPNNQWNAADRRGILLYVGQAEEALAWFKRAKEIDPYFDEPWYWRSIGEAQMVLQRYQEALAAFDHSPGRTYRIAAFMAGSYARLADMEHARVSAAECLAMKPDFSIAHFMAKHPFKNRGDAASLAESLRMAGLPE